jgi:hypothetical protein
MSSSVAAAAPVLRGGRVCARVLLALGVLAFGLMFWGFQRDPQRAYHAYLTAYAFVLSAVIGCLAFVMISHAANATWPVALRRLPEAVAPAMPLLALLFVPVLLGIHPLYPWAHASEYTGEVRRMIEHRQPFMNPGFFTLRAAVYLVLWSGFAWSLRANSLALDRGRDPERCARRLRALSYAGLPLIALTSGFASFEWFMSLSPTFASTMFGALWIALCLFAGMACTVLLTGIMQRVRPSTAIGPSHYSALGRLLLTFLIFLGYAAFFQFLLCWMGNLPHEAAWFLQRSRGVYWYISLFLIFGHFGLPLFALLSYRLKRNIAALTPVAVWCLGSHYLHLHWLITPSSNEPGFSWFDLVALVAVLATTTSFCIGLQRGKALAAVADPRYLASLAYQSR